MSFLDLPDKIYDEVQPNDDWDGRTIYEIFHNNNKEQCFRLLLNTSRGNCSLNLSYLAWIIIDYGIENYIEYNVATLKDLLLFDIYYNEHKLKERMKENSYGFSRESVKEGRVLFYDALTDSVMDNYEKIHKIVCKSRYNEEIYDEPYEPYREIQDRYKRISSYGNKKYNTGNLVANKFNIIDIYEGMDNGIYYY